MTRPSPLVLVWLGLVALTAAAMLIGHVEARTRLAGWEATLLLVFALIKARWVLEHYLELGRSSGWFAGLSGSIALVLLVISGLAFLR